MKILKNINKLSDSQIKHIKTEIRIMKALHHPNIVNSKLTLASQRKIYILMQYIGGGTLLQLLQKERISPKQARRYFIQIALALEYCHNHAIAHRDLKAENVLLDEDHQMVYVSDFGLASIYSDDAQINDVTNSDQQRNLLKTCCGSPYYISPEICLRKPYNGIKTDVWSAGILLYLMLIRRYPFDAQTHELLQEAIIRGQFTFPQAKIESGQCPQSAVRLIREMLQLDPEKRPNFTQILQSEFVQEDSEYYKAWSELCQKECQQAEQKQKEQDPEDGSEN